MAYRKQSFLEYLNVFTVFTFMLIVSAKCAYQPYRNTDPDFAASVYHLKSLAVVEMYILPFAVSAFQNEIRTGSHVDMNSYITDFKTSIVDPLGADISLEQLVVLLNHSYINTGNLADDVVKHTLKSFRTIRRFVRYINKFPEITQNKALLQALEVAQEVISFPKESDLEAAMQNILRLRQIFQLSITDLLEGKLGSMKTRSGLTVTQLADIGDHAYSLKMYSHAVDMYDGVINRCKKNRPKEFDDCSRQLNLTEISKKLDSTIIEHDKLVKNLVENEDHPTDLSVAPPDSSPYIFGAPLLHATSADFKDRVHLEIDYELETLVANSNANFSKVDRDMAVSPYVFERLCRGNSLKTPAEEASLKCHYMTNSHPVYLLSPLKIEVHNENPRLVQIYDIITDKEIEELQKEVQDEMRQSRTAATDGEDSGMTSRFRTSANAWIEDNATTKFKYLNERISRISGLNTTGYYSSEIVQIAAYNPGCHYTPHSDAIFEEVLLSRLPESEFQRGDRMATFMLYLSDVEMGGGTGFPTLKTVVQPVKGSGVLWYNLHLDGSINYDVLHGGCPVLYGTKWIANKWIRANDQMFIRKCSKDRG